MDLKHALEFAADVQPIDVDSGILEDVRMKQFSFHYKRVVVSRDCPSRFTFNLNVFISHKVLKRSTHFPPVKFSQSRSTKVPKQILLRPHLYYEFLSSKLDSDSVDRSNMGLMPLNVLPLCAINILLDLLTVCDN